MGYLRWAQTAKMPFGGGRSEVRNSKKPKNKKTPPPKIQNPFPNPRNPRNPRNPNFNCFVSLVFRIDPKPPPTNEGPSPRKCHPAAPQPTHSKRECSIQYAISNYFEMAEMTEVESSLTPFTALQSPPPRRCKPLSAGR